MKRDAWLMRPRSCLLFYEKAVDEDSQVVWYVERRCVIGGKVEDD